MKKQFTIVHLCSERFETTFESSFRNRPRPWNWKLALLALVFFCHSQAKAQCYLAASWHDNPATCPFSPDGSLCCDSIWGILPGTGLPPYGCSIVDPPGTYTYDAASNCFINLLPGEYDVEITSGDSCTGSFFNLMVGSVYDELTLDNFTTTNATCAGNDGSICINIGGGSGSYSYLWTGPPNYNTPIGTASCLNALAPGFYQVTVSDNAFPLYCHLDLSLHVSGTTALAGSGVVSYNPCIAGPELLGCNTCQSIIDLTIVGGTAPFTYIWTGPGGYTASTQDLTNICDGTYNVVVNDAGGCTYTGSFVVGPVIGYDVVGDLIISTSTVWNNVSPYGPNITINGNVIVNPGVTLTINNANVQLARGKAIRTMGGTSTLAGGQIIASNSTFTSADPAKTWRGFEVLGVGGNPTVAQIAANKRSFLSLRDCQVLRAETGIRNLEHGIACNGSITYTKNATSSGRIFCENTTFRNNLRDINFQNYVPQEELGVANSELARFVNCTFLFDQFPTCTEISTLLPGSERIRLNHVTAVRFESCQALVVNNTFTLGVGLTTVFIKASNSWFDWLGCQTGGLNCSSSIIGFSQGINVSGDFNPAFIDYGLPTPVYTNADRIIRIDESLFQCANGISVAGAINGLSSVQIIENTFEDTPAFYGNIQGSSTANTRVRIANTLALETRFVINGNDFVTTETWIYSYPPIVPYRSYAIEVSNCGQAGNNYIYSNNIKGFYKGIYTQNVNRDPAAGSPTGLHYECNRFQDNKNDVELRYTDANANNKCVAAVQQRTWPNFIPLRSAGNIFTASIESSTPDDDIYRQSIGIGIVQNVPEQWYYYYPGELNTNGPYEMSYTESSFGVENLVTSRLHAWHRNNQHGCPLLFEPIANLQSGTNLTVLHQQYQEQKDLLLQLRDGGNTENLKEIVEATTFSNAMATYQKLLQASPQLSMDVMITAIQKEYEIPASWLTVILASNPHATTSTELTDALQAREIQLDEFQLSLILNARQQNLTPYQICLQMMANVRNEIVETRQSYFNYVGSNATNASTGDLLDMFDITYNYGELMQKATLLRSIGEFETSLDLLSSAESLYKMTPEEITTNSELIEIWQIEHEALVNQSGVLTPEQFSQLEHYWIDDEFNTGREALRVLQSLTNYQPVYHDLPEDNNLRSEKFANPVIKQNLVRLYPNPAEDFALIQFLNGLDEDISVELYTIEGRVVLKQKMKRGQKESSILLSDQSAGDYFVVFRKNNGDLLEKLPLIKR